MKKNNILFIFILVLSGCSFLLPGKFTNTEDTISIYDENDLDLFKKEKLVKIYKKGNYELLIPLCIIPNYISFRSDRFLEFYSLYTSILENDTSKIVIDDRLELNINNNYYYTKKPTFKVMQLFESGEFFIYDLKNKEYIKDIVIKKDWWYGGPLSASWDTWVLIGNFIFWEDHLQA